MENQYHVEKQLIELMGARLVSRLSDVRGYLKQDESSIALTVYSGLKSFCLESEMTYHLVFPNFDLFLFSLRKGPLEYSLYEIEGDIDFALQNILEKVQLLIKESLDELSELEAA